LRSGIIDVRARYRVAALRLINTALEQLCLGCGGAWEIGPFDINENVFHLKYWIECSCVLCVRVKTSVIFVPFVVSAVHSYGT